jgi:hypothetical protein
MTEQEFIDQYPPGKVICLIIEEEAGPKVLWKNVNNPYKIFGTLAQAKAALEKFIRDGEMKARAQQMQQVQQDAQLANRLKRNGIIHGK